MGVDLETIHPGDGQTYPKDGQFVSVHYVEAKNGLIDMSKILQGTLEDGRIFDSSRDRGSPITFQIGKQQVIKGWDEGIKKMSIGQRAMLTCSPDYAYGKKGYPGVYDNLYRLAVWCGYNYVSIEYSIPGNSTLKLDVELLEIKQ